MNRCVTGAAAYYTPAPTASDIDGCGSDKAILIHAFYPDQVWVDGVPLLQVLDKSLVVQGTFWLQRTAATDAYLFLFTEFYIYSHIPMPLSCSK